MSKSYIVKVMHNLRNGTSSKIYVFKLKLMLLIAIQTVKYYKNTNKHLNYIYFSFSSHCNIFLCSNAE